MQDQVLTLRFRNSIQKSLKKNGLNIEIENIHWSGWGSFNCSKVSLIDAKQKLTLVQTEQLKINVDLLSLLINKRHLERALRKVELINPSLRLKRYSDGSWNLQKYFPKSNRKLRLETVFIIQNGAVELEDGVYGRHNLTQINGKSPFLPRPIFKLECGGSSDFNRNFHGQPGDAHNQF